MGTRTGGIPSTGHRASTPKALVSRVGLDGLIDKEYRYDDLMGMAPQLELL